jgi:hypothetical protein
MLVGEDNGPFTSRVKAVIRALCDEYRLIYTYDYVQGSGLLHFDDEFCCSPQPEAETWKKLESWQSPGVYHLIGHAASASPELDALCSPEHPSRRWAAQYRLKDLDFFTSPVTRTRIDDLGFELIDLPRLRELSQKSA